MSETKQAEFEGVEKGFLGGVIEALANKHSELDLTFKKVTVTLPNVRMSVELNGVVTVSAHMRDLSAEEAKAMAEKNVETMSKA